MESGSWTSKALSEGAVGADISGGWGSRGVTGTTTTSAPRISVTASSVMRFTWVKTPRRKARVLLRWAARAPPSPWWRQCWAAVMWCASNIMHVDVCMTKHMILLLLHTHHCQLSWMGVKYNIIYIAFFSWDYSVAIFITCTHTIILVCMNTFAHALYIHK